MNVMHEKHKSYPEKIVFNGEACLGIPTGPVAKKYFFARLSELKKHPGWIVKDGGIREWRIEGLCNLEDNTYFYGPPVEGRLLDEYYHPEMPDWQDFLLQLLEAYCLLCDSRGVEFILYSLGVICLEGGGFLFLPPQIISEIIAVSTGDIQTRQKQLLNHPDLQGAESVAYFAAVFAYNSLTGELPYHTGTGDELNFKIRNRKPVPLHYSLPGLKKEVGDFITRAFARKNNPLPTPGEWVSRLKTWQEEGIFEQVTPQEEQQLREKAGQNQRLIDKKYQLALFWQKNRTRIIAITAVVAVLFAIAGTSLYNLYFRPRITIGLDPLELVQTYYASINTVDFTTLDDCVLKGASQADVTEVMNLFVLGRQQMAMTRENPYYPADKWVTEGKPPVPFKQQVYGIARLEIREINDPGGPVFEAQYEKWRTEFPDEELSATPQVSYTGVAHTDRLYLKKDRGGWIIYRLDRIRSEELEDTPGTQAGK